MVQSRRFSHQFKAEAVQLVIQSGRPIAEIARELAINEGIVRARAANGRAVWPRGGTHVGSGCLASPDRSGPAPGQLRDDEARPSPTRREPSAPQQRSMVTTEPQVA